MVRNSKRVIGKVQNGKRVVGTVQNGKRVIGTVQNGKRATRSVRYNNRKAVQIPVVTNGAECRTVLIAVNGMVSLTVTILDFYHVFRHA